ncbi:hypothetical protein O6H91_14G049400 [Diphasiastrum complanatum]|uniref:Uncharacterized protein n=1 Tax=Diphasiastrum complanatum TaxID=34168 RepID=A0ACC2BPG2_DIPCM|nr:hypothetical protein O6H91_14G049400 [Diphasiastrum complanatum]
MLVNMIEKLIAKFSSDNSNCEDFRAATRITDSEPFSTPKLSECEKVQGTRQALWSIEPKWLVNKSCEFDALVPQLPDSGQLSELGTQEGRQQEETNEYVSHRSSNEGTLYMDRSHEDRLKNVVHWMKRVALNPGDASKGQGPRVSRQTKQSVDECIAITCRFKACLWKGTGAREGFSLSDKAVRINLSKYYDEAFYEDRMTLKIHQLSDLNGRIKSSRLFAKALDEITNHGMPRKRAAIGPDFQADLPPCVLSQPYVDPVSTRLLTREEEVDRWLGTEVWPCLGGKRVVNMERIGRGRPFTCSCAYSESSACHRLHIRADKEELMLELGDAFYKWGFHEMGESTLSRWTKREQENFQVIVKTNPASAKSNFWDKLPTTFPAKSMKELVSYYFNVYVLRGREIQNRLHSEVIDSDDDEDEISTYINTKTNFCT